MSPLFDVRTGQVREVAQFYQLVELIGTGRFSEVYRAFDTATQTDVAFKVYVQSDEPAHALMHAERDVLASLGSLNTEYFPKARKGIKTRIKNRNHPVLIMELGQYIADDSTRAIISLRDVVPDRNGVAAKRLPFDWTWSFATSFVADLLRASRLLHEHGIIHRDLKLSNILLKKPAGTTAVMPFLIDFNSSTSADNPSASSATPQYLPPEVRSGQRVQPTIADDLWAVAAMAWELVHGIGAEIRSGVPAHVRLADVPGPPALEPALLKALAVDPATRFKTAHEFLLALTGGGATDALEISGNISPETFIEARKSVPEIRQCMLEALAGEDEIIIPKDVREQVAIIFAWLAEDHTQPVDLSADVIALGPTAIPAALEEAYKLAPSGPSFEHLVRALARLARPHRPYAERAIVHYSLSSNFGTRSLARALCAELEIFPTLLLDLLVADDGLLIPSERVDLADLCIQYCDRPSSVLALVKYMCREYILDGNRYRELRDRVATRMAPLRFDQTARLLVQDAERHIWDEIEEFERVPATRRPDVEKGLLQLMGDAFASQGERALDLFQRGQVPRYSTGGNRLRVFRTFGRKLAHRYPPAAEWFKAEAAKQPANQDLTGVVQYLDEQPIDAQDADASVLLDRYFSGDAQASYYLRSTKDPQLFSLLDEVLASRPTVAAQTVRLLRGFQSRWRPLVVNLALKHWKVLASADYDSAADILSAHAIRDERLRSQAVAALEADLGGPNKSVARRGIDSLLEHQ